MTIKPERHYRVSGTGTEAPHSGKPLYRVECLTCGKTVDTSTMWPEERIRFHELDSKLDCRVRGGLH